LIDLRTGCGIVRRPVRQDIQQGRRRGISVRRRIGTIANIVGLVVAGGVHGTRLVLSVLVRILRAPLRILLHIIHGAHQEFCPCRSTTTSTFLWLLFESISVFSCVKMIACKGESCADKKKRELLLVFSKKIHSTWTYCICIVSENSTPA
jgi:hypothetical protein